MRQKIKTMRHESKYLISSAKAKELSGCLKAVLKQDENQDGGGDYFIRSLYLDDVQNSSYWDKIAGIRERKKYRIRIYNGNSDVIKLECKEKMGERIHKDSVLIDRKCCEQLIDGNYEGLKEREERLCREVYLLRHTKGLHNSVIVDYDREAYTFPVSNVRITFDKNLHAGGGESFDIFHSDLITLPIYQNQSVILEVKYDTVLPTFVGELLSSFRLGAIQSVSKYCICKELIKQMSGSLKGVES